MVENIECRKDYSAVFSNEGAVKFHKSWGVWHKNCSVARVRRMLAGPGRV